MDDKMTHTVTIIVSGNYPHGQKQHSQVTLSGDGGLDHMIEAFKASLIAAGFSIDTAKKLDEIDAEENDMQVMEIDVLDAAKAFANEDKLAEAVRWLEANQPDVFKRGIWDAINAA